MDIWKIFKSENFDGGSRLFASVAYYNFIGDILICIIFFGYIRRVNGLYFEGKILKSKMIDEKVPYGPFL